MHTRFPYLRPLAGVAALIGAAVVSVGAQQPASLPETQPQEVFRSSVDVVTIQASVHDGRGRALSGLTAADFEVRDNGQIRPVLSLRSDQRSPLSLAFLVDMSGSMRVGPKIDLTRRAFEAMLSQLGEASDEAALFTFDSALTRQASGRSLNNTDQFNGIASVLLGIPTNGSILANVVQTFARQRDDGLADWIAANAAFPSSMVDRIAPAVTQDDLDSVEQWFGYRDAPVAVGEPFRKIGQNRRLGNLRQARRSDVAPSRLTEQWHDRAVFVGIALIGRVPHRHIVFEILQQFSNLIGGDRLNGFVSAAAPRHLRDQSILRRQIHEAGRSYQRERLCAQF